MDEERLSRDAQIAATAEGAFSAQMENRFKNLHTSLPGIIASFDPVTQMASVQPAIQRVFTENGAVNLPLCVDVPVAFPGGGGYFLTFPVQPGDECILLFSERAIDLWHVQGGTRPPAEYRLHDLSDGMALVGLNSQPNKIPAFSAANTELRSRDGQTRVTMKPDGEIENANSEASTRLTSGGKFIINAPGGIELNGNTLVKGNITGQPGNGGTGAANFDSDVVAQGVSLKTHTHSGVQPGGGNTGQPN